MKINEKNIVKIIIVSVLIIIYGRSENLSQKYCEDKAVERYKATKEKEKIYLSCSGPNFYFKGLELRSDECKFENIDEKKTK